MKTKIKLLLLGAILCSSMPVPNESYEVSAILKTTASEVHSTKNAEIVFCLDATGSMSGLIGTAKEKIWDIVSELAQESDIDTLRMGMIFYRDRGDDFITKKIEMTSDLDDAYTELLKINAAGGGDSPESVNQALYESVTDMEWSRNGSTYRTIFVVGDCPPHMDYQDDVKYTESCKLAVEKGITINTIKLGNSCVGAITHFKKMSECTNGTFLRLDQNANDYVIATPYDVEINRISYNIDNSRIFYGTKEEQDINYSKKAKSMAVYIRGSSTSNSDRAEYKQSKAGQKSAYGNKEVINDFENGKLNLDEIKDDELPEILKGKSISEKESVLIELSQQRKADTKTLKELLKKKNEYIRSKEKKDSTSFSREVIKVMMKQANKSSL